ncbi:unnamed protein product [Brassicogethes aeneus]|uniref:Rhodanese domain-containing protein n=1 Tax=Brassicogethes aeneus TaxID=1431903 RepID=A0A9P0B2V4_BRAAE|nr:unnamed protein product [Brassicogethes aeneus]
MLKLCFGGLLFACVLQLSSTKMSVKIATFDEVKNLNKNVVLIDVREPSELKEFGVIPGSINIPLKDVEKALKDLSSEEFGKLYGKNKPSLDTEIIFSCRSGRRSGLAADIAVKLGYQNVKNYQGSWLEWEQKIKE